MAEIRVNTTGTLKLFDADDSHSAGIAAGTITADATLMTLNTADIDISVPIDVTGASTITTADNTDTLSLISTDADANVGPILRLFRNSASPADDDVIGNIVFSGEDDAGNETDFLTFQVNAGDVGNGAEDGFMRIMMPVASTSTEFFRMNPAGFVFNEGSADLDFRVESNDATHQLFVDAGNNKVYMGSGSGNSIDNMHLQLQNQGLTVSSFANDSNSNEIHFIKSRNTTVGSSTVVADGDQLGSIIFQGDDGTDYATPAASIRGIVGGSPGGNDMPGALTFSTTADGASSVTERMRIYKNGMIQFSPGTNSRYYKIDPDVDSFYPTVNNVSDLGYSNLKWDDVYATNGTIQTSDKNVKDNITTSDLGLDFVNKLKPVSYKFKEKTRTHYGLIAQDIEDVLSDISKSTTGFAGFIKTQKEDHSVWTKDDSETQGDNPTAKIGHLKNPIGTKIDGEYSYALRYEEFISPMIKAIQELATKVKALEEA